MEKKNLFRFSFNCHVGISLKNFFFEMYLVIFFLLFNFLFFSTHNASLLRFILICPPYITHIYCAQLHPLVIWAFMHLEQVHSQPILDSALQSKPESKQAKQGSRELQVPSESVIDSISSSPILEASETKCETPDIETMSNVALRKKMFSDEENVYDSSLSYEEDSVPGMFIKVKPQIKKKMEFKL